MPIAACDDCSRYFVVEEAKAGADSCSRCGQPLRISSRTETVTYLRTPHTPPRPKAPPGIVAPEQSAFKHHLSQRAHWARAANVSQRAELSARVRELRRLRREMQELMHQMESALRESG